MNTSGFYISATKRNSGKTSLAIAICRLLKQKNFDVQPFKKGPDFIDPMWLSIASQRNCYNLDFYFLSGKKIVKHFIKNSIGSDISIVEGNHGLYDSTDLYGRTSNASLAKLLGLPVILVVDVSEMNRSIVPMILGFKDFDKDLSLNGLLLNKVHSKRHEKNLIKAVEYYTDINVVGAVPNDSEISIKQRHLGLVSTLNKEELDGLIDKIAGKVSGYIDIPAILKISNVSTGKIKMAGKIDKPVNSLLVPASDNSNAAGKHASAPGAMSLPAGNNGIYNININGINDINNININNGNISNRKKRLKIGIAFDGAFNFYYNENLEQLKDLGVELDMFSPLNDPVLPEVDAVYIGGGFPEVFAQDLEANYNIRRDIKEKVEYGLPVYAECGGLMYLCRSITYDETKSAMVGIIDADVKLTKKPKGHGYTMLKPLNHFGASWQWHQNIRSLKGHEFHHSFLDNMSNISFGFDVIRGHGVNGSNDGIICKNVLASFTHVYSKASPSWFKKWVSFIKNRNKLFFLDNL